MHYVTSVRVQDHSLIYMFNSTQFSKYNIVMMYWLLFVVSTYIKSGKLLQTKDFYFFTVVLHSETVGGVNVRQLKTFHYWNDL